MQQTGFNWQEFGRDAFIVQIEIDPKEFPVDSFERSRPPTSKIDLADVDDCRDSYLLENLLTSEEAQHLIDCAERIGMDFWDPAYSDSHHAFRRAYTVESHHPQLANILWNRIKHLNLPNVIISEEDEFRHEIDIVGEWVPVGINPRFLFSRYQNAH